jgi:hypothetical protein
MVTVLLLGVLLAREAQAFYNPSTGRWLSRDQLEEHGGMNVYAADSNDNINGIDRDGRVNIYRSQGEVDLCTWVDLLYKLSLDSNPIDDGYIVQHLTISEIGDDCDGTRYIFKSADFYEELGPIIKKDDPGSWLGGWFRYDMNRFLYMSKRGNIHVHREVNFFFKDVTGDLEMLWSRHSIPGFDTGPAVRTRPVWWSAGVETMAQNTWTISYHCCCGNAGLPGFFDTAPGRPVEIDY